jgi:hypothetical protein
MHRHVRQNHNPLDQFEQAFAREFSSSLDAVGAAIRAGYPRQDAARVADLLLADIGIREAVLALLRGKVRKSLRLRWAAEDDAAFAEHVRGNLPVLIQATRERLASIKPPPPGEIIIERRTTRAERRAAAKEHAHV